MRVLEALLALALVGCHYPYPVFVSSGGGMFVPPRVAKEPLSPAGAKVVVVTEAPACGFLGLATGVGGAKDQYQPSADGDVPKHREEALVALRNVVGARGGTHVVIDATAVYGSVHQWEQVILRGRAFRC